MSASGSDATVALPRGAPLAPDPWRLGGWLVESERELDPARLVPALTLFLVGARCPFSCVFCDLHWQTVAGPTPPGAIPEQIAQGLAGAGKLGADSAIKLYNASNFFDERAVPADDDAAIAQIVAPFARVTVECHPRLVGERAYRFAERLTGRLEVAMGLETVAPQAFPRLSKGMTLADFDRAVDALDRRGIATRAFVLLAPPYVAPAEAVDWTVRSVEHAIAAGAERVTILPTRGGELTGHAARGDFLPPTLAQLEAALELTVEAPGAVVTADLWDAPRLFAGEAEAGPRLERLERMNLSGRNEPPVAARRGTG